MENGAKSNQQAGIYIQYSDQATLTNNTVSENNMGIYLSSDSCLLKGNRAILNDIGIRILSYESVMIENIVSNNHYGFFLLEGSTQNLLKFNHVSDNDYGISLYNTAHNRIINNNFIDNLTQTQASDKDDFYMAPPVGGNYWSNWSPPDHPDTDNNGFVDQAYFFNGSNRDSGWDVYPWAHMFVTNQPPVATITGPDSGSIHAIAGGILLEGSIDDPDIGTGDTHTAVWAISNENWSEDLEIEGTVSGTSVSDVVYLSEAGIYSIALTVTDASGASDTTSIVDDVEDMPSFVVLYDPEGGFVTGGGWIWSPAGTYLADPTLEGQANFGFVSKYKKGATVPTGSTEFHFQAGDFNFHSSAYEWLVVNGNNTAKFKGTGTVNGQGDFRFMLWAGDGDLDTFRIRIWTEDETGLEGDVYDSGDEDQVIGGGSVVIHNNK